jgi:alcohol dehydrogenase (cytochrome c)
MKRYIAAFALLGTAAAFAQGRGGQPAPPAPTPEVLQNYQPVTEARLRNPEPENWLMLRRTYDGWGYSPLKQITTANVSKLKPVWSFSTGEQLGH